MCVIKIMRILWLGHVAQMEVLNAQNVLVCKSEKKRHIGRTRRRWDDTIEMDLNIYCGKLCVGFIWLKIGTVYRIF
jgi:hypothetical protein